MSISSRFPGHSDASCGRNSVQALRSGGFGASVTSCSSTRPALAANPASGRQSCSTMPQPPFGSAPHRWWVDDSPRPPRGMRIDPAGAAGTLSAFPSHPRNRLSSSCLVRGRLPRHGSQRPALYAARCATRRPHGDVIAFRTRPPQRGRPVVRSTARDRRGRRTGSLGHNLHAEICER